VRLRSLLLLLPQEVYDELLVLFNEVIRQTLVLKIRSKVLTPKGVKGIQKRELRMSVAVEIGR
jgi:hypothetical protein